MMADAAVSVPNPRQDIDFFFVVFTTIPTHSEIGFRTPFSPKSLIYDHQ